MTAIAINNELGGVWDKYPAHTIITPDKAENTKYKKQRDGEREGEREGENVKEREWEKVEP